MPEGDFNQVPKQCLGICELDQADVDKHGIVLSLNCNGPSFEGPDPKETVRLKNGEVIGIEEGRSVALGRAACTNRGFNLWLQDRKAQFNATPDAP